MIIAIDFDGTQVKHEYPEIGEEVPHAFRVMKRLQDEGHELILLTMRDDKPSNKGEEKRPVLTEAVEYCRKKGIVFDGVNINNHQTYWSQSRKVYANIYVDDAALYAPLIRCHEGRPYVDWLAAEKWFESEGHLEITPYKGILRGVSEDPSKEEVEPPEGFIFKSLLEANEVCDLMVEALRKFDYQIAKVDGQWLVVPYDGFVAKNMCMIRPSEPRRYEKQIILKTEDEE